MLSSGFNVQDGFRSKGLNSDVKGDPDVKGEDYNVKGGLLM